MKRVRCPKCDNYIQFDETKYQEGQSLVFICDNCKKQFGIRIGKSKLNAGSRREEVVDEKEGQIVYTLRDNNSITGTFLMNELLGPKERVRIEEGNIFTLGATTLILRGANSNDTSCED